MAGGGGFAFPLFHPTHSIFPASLHSHFHPPHTHSNLELLRAESLHLSERNDFMRQQLSTPQPTKYTQDKKVLEEENAMLRQALLTALEGLSEEDDEEHGAAEPKTVTGSGGAAP